MTLTNFQVLTLYPALASLRDDKDLKLPVRVGYKLLRNIELLSSSYETIQKMRDEIVIKYGDLIDDKGTYQVPPEKVEEANKELNDLAQVEAEYNILPIELKQIEDLPLSLDSLNSIYEIIIDGE